MKDPQRMGEGGEGKKRNDIQYLMVYYSPRSKIHRHFCYNGTVEEKLLLRRYHKYI